MRKLFFTLICFVSMNAYSGKNDGKFYTDKKKTFKFELSSNDKVKINDSYDKETSRAIFIYNDDFMNQITVQNAPIKLNGVKSSQENIVSGLSEVSFDMMRSKIPDLIVKQSKIIELPQYGLANFMIIVEPNALKNSLYKNESYDPGYICYLLFIIENKIITIMHTPSSLYSLISNKIDTPEETFFNELQESMINISNKLTILK